MKEVYLYVYLWSIFVAAYRITWVFLFDADLIFTLNILQFYQMLRNCPTKIKIKFLCYEQSTPCHSTRDSSVSYASAAAKIDDSSSIWRSSLKIDYLYFSFKEMDIMFLVSKLTTCLESCDFEHVIWSCYGCNLQILNLHCVNNSFVFKVVLAVDCGDEGVLVLAVAFADNVLMSAMVQLSCYYDADVVYCVWLEVFTK